MALANSLPVVPTGADVVGGGRGGRGGGGGGGGTHQGRCGRGSVASPEVDSGGPAFPLLTLETGHHRLGGPCTIVMTKAASETKQNKRTLGR